MEYFTEYFQETDEEEAAELMKELGTPKEAARELMANLLDKKIEDHQSYEADGRDQSGARGLRQACGMDRTTGVVCSAGGNSFSWHLRQSCWPWLCVHWLFCYV